MGFKVPKILLEAFRDKTLDIISVVGIYRTQILELDNFSEMAASSAFEKEIIHSRKQKTYNLQLFTKN